MPTCREGPIGLSLTIPFQRHLHSKALPYGQEPDRRSCWDLHVITLDPASKEYSRAVEPHLPKSVRFLTCTFGEWKNGKAIEKGTMCKMARGQLVRWLAENDVTSRADIRAFDQLGHRSQPELSDENHDVFLKNGTEK